MKLVLVHGRSQQGKDPVELKNEWVTALKKGLEDQRLQLPPNIDVELPFYGDKLDEFVKIFEAGPGKDTTAKGREDQVEFLQFQGLLAEELRKRAGVSNDLVDIEYGDNPKEKGLQNMEWVQAILRALDKHIKGMSEQTLKMFTIDVFLYIKRSRVRSKIDKIVTDAFSNEPMVVIGHSLGSVVAYNALRGDSPAIKVPLYLTLGSPLGVTSIRNALKPLKFPGPVSAWYNAFDEEDIVALYPLDENNFPVEPAIENNNKAENDTDNKHGITGYLKIPVVAKRIYDALVQG